MASELVTTPSMKESGYGGEGDVLRGMIRHRRE